MVQIESGVVDHRRSPARWSSSIDLAASNSGCFEGSFPCHDCKFENVEHHFDWFLGRQDSW